MKKAKIMEFSVIIHKDVSGGYWGEVAGLPGCYSQGDTQKQLLEHMKEAIECHLGAKIGKSKTNSADVVGIRKVAVYAKT